MVIGDALIRLDELIESQVFMVSGFGMLICGCSRQTAKWPHNDAKTTASRICAAVHEYKESHTNLEPELRRELALVSMDKFILDAIPNNQTFGFGDLWRYDATRTTLTSQGYWVGEEHSWYEIPLKVELNEVSVVNIEKRREILKR